MRMYVRPHVPGTLLISRLVPKSIAELGDRLERGGIDRSVVWLGLCQVSPRFIV